MDTSVMVSLDGDVVAYLDQVQKQHPAQSPSDYINELLRAEMRRASLPERENTRASDGQPLEIPGRSEQEQESAR